METNGNIVLKMRRAMRLSRRKLANAFEIHQSTILRWESGQVEPGALVVLAMYALRDMGVDGRSAWTEKRPSEADTL